MRLRWIAATATAALLLAGCQTGPGGVAGTGWGTGQTFGTVGGAVAGGLIGSQIGGGTGRLVATGAGVALGAFLGNQMGAAFDQPTQNAVDQAGQQALNTGQMVNWQDPRTGNYGTITPSSQSYYQGGRECRQFTQTIYINGRAETASGMACRAPNGYWQVAG